MKESLRGNKKTILLLPCYTLGENKLWGEDRDLLIFGRGTCQFSVLVLSWLSLSLLLSLAGCGHQGSVQKQIHPITGQSELISCFPRVSVDGQGRPRQRGQGLLHSRDCSEVRLHMQTEPGSTLALQLTSRVTLIQSLNFSQPQFPTKVGIRIPPWHVWCTEKDKQKLTP